MDQPQPSQRRPHAEVMDGLKAKLGEVAAAVDRSAPVVYLDYPVHNNIGDLLIHQGGDAFLAAYGFKVLGRYSLQDLCRVTGPRADDVSLKPAIADLDAHASDRSVTLLMHGGGNLGDVWPTFQRFRELVLARYPDNRIVILPQSVHFADRDVEARAAEIFGRHRHLTTFVRDRESLAFVESYGGRAAMMPDMAHQLWGGMGGEIGGGEGTLVQRRRDKESREAGATRAFDWDDLYSAADMFLFRALRKWKVIGLPTRHVVPNAAIWRVYRDAVVRRAVDRFRPYETIDTDRLHGIILGALLGKQVRYGDGSYGKLHRYAALWLDASDRIESAMASRP